MSDFYNRKQTLLQKISEKQIQLAEEMSEAEQEHDLLKVEAIIDRLYILDARYHKAVHASPRSN